MLQLIHGAADFARLDIVNYISHGMSKVAEEKSEKEEGAAEPGERDAEGGGALEKYAALVGPANLGAVTHSGGRK